MNRGLSRCSSLLLFAIVVVGVVVPVSYVVARQRSGLNRQLWQVAGLGDLEIGKTLIDKGANPDARYENGKTLLMLAAERDMVEAVRVLKQLGASLDLVDNDGNTVEYYARKSQNPRIVEMLSVDHN